MTQDEIIEMAIEAGWKDLRNFDSEMHEFLVMGSFKDLKRFAKLVAAKEREACAILCDNRSSFYWNWQEGNLQKHEENRHYAKASEECADAIRARGEQA